MKTSEATQLARRLAQVFPLQVMQAQGANAIKQFEQHEFAAVDAAITEHRRTRDTLDWPALFAGCAAVNGNPESRKEGSFAAIARRQNPQLAGVASDVEVILRKHRGWWHGCGRREGYRRGLAISCLNQVYATMLEQLPKDDSGSVSDADAAVAYESAERLAACIFESAHDFDLALRGLRGDLVGV